MEEAQFFPKYDEWPVPLWEEKEGDGRDDAAEVTGPGWEGGSCSAILGWGRVKDAAITEVKDHVWATRATGIFRVAVISLLFCRL